MKKHFLKCDGLKDVCKKMDSKGSKSSKSHGEGKPNGKPKKDNKDKKDKDDKCGKKDDKPCRSESKSSNKAASQKQVLESLHCSQCIAESTAGGGHHKSHKKLRKCSKKLHKSHKKMCQ